MRTQLHNIITGGFLYNGELRLIYYIAHHPKAIELHHRTDRNSNVLLLLVEQYRQREVRLVTCG